MRHPPLAWVLLRQMSVAALLLALAMAAGVAGLYLADTGRLHRQIADTLAAEADAAMDKGAATPPPGAWDTFPGAYGWRLLDRDDGDPPRVLAARNATLFPAAADRPKAGTVSLTLGEGTVAVTTLYARAAGARRWLQVAVAADPARFWLRLVGHEVLDHVAQPIALMVPALTLALWIVTRRALRPLDAVARAAAALHRGDGPRALPDAGLPREMADVVQALNSLLLRLEGALGGLRRFAGEAAHELRTPLAVLRLEADAMPPGVTRTRMAAQLDALTARVDALLRIAEAEDGAAAGMAPFDLSAAARGVCQELAPLAAEGGRVLEFSAPDGPVTVRGSAALAAIAVRNLLDNALRATPQGGAVEVAVAPDGTVSVRDHGPGVPAAARHSIFTRFSRGPGGGAGIGLSLVRRVAALHGGAAWVEDAEGGGARFVLRLTPGGRAGG